MENLHISHQTGKRAQANYDLKNPNDRMLDRVTAFDMPTATKIKIGVFCVFGGIGAFIAWGIYKFCQHFIHMPKKITEFADVKLQGAVAPIKIVDGKPTIKVKLMVGEADERIEHEIAYTDAKDDHGHTYMLEWIDGVAGEKFPDTNVRAEQAKWRADIKKDKDRYLACSSLYKIEQGVEVEATDQQRKLNKLILLSSNHDTIAFKSMQAIKKDTQGNDFIGFDLVDAPSKPVLVAVDSVPVNATDNLPNSARITFTQVGNDIVVKVDNDEIHTILDMTLAEFKANNSSYVRANKDDYSHYSKDIQLKVSQALAHNSIMARMVAMPISESTRTVTFRDPLLNEEVSFSEQNNGGVLMKIGDQPVETFSATKLSELQSTLLKQMSKNKAAYLEVEQSLISVCETKQEIEKLQNLALDPTTLDRSSDLFTELVVKAVVAPITKSSNTTLIKFSLSNKAEVVFQTKGEDVEVGVNGLIVGIFKKTNLAALQLAWSKDVSDHSKTTYFPNGQAPQATLETACRVKGEFLKANLPSALKDANFVGLTLKSVATPIAKKGIQVPYFNAYLTYESKGADVHIKVSQTKEDEQTLVAIMSDVSLAELQTRQSEVVANNVEQFKLQNNLQLVTQVRLHNALENGLALEAIQSANQEKSIKFDAETGVTVTYAEQAADVVRTINDGTNSPIVTTFPATTLEKLQDTARVRLSQNRLVGPAAAQALTLAVQKLEKSIQLQTVLTSATQIEHNKTKKNAITVPATEGVTITYLQEQGKVIKSVNNGQLQEEVQGVATLDELKEQFSDVIAKNSAEYLTKDNLQLVNNAKIVGSLNRIGTDRFKQDDFDRLNAECSPFLKEILNVKKFNFESIQKLNPLSEQTKEIIFNFKKQSDATKVTLTSLSRTLGTYSFIDNADGIAKKGAKFVMNTVTTEPVTVVTAGNQKTTLTVELEDGTEVSYEGSGTNLNIKVGKTVVGILHNMSMAELKSKLSRVVGSNQRSSYTAWVDDAKLIDTVRLHNDIELNLAKGPIKQDKDKGKMLTFNPGAGFQITYREQETEEQGRHVVQTITHKENKTTYTTVIPNTTLEQWQDDARVRMIHNKEFDQADRNSILESMLKSLEKPIGLQAVVTSITTERNQQRVIQFDVANAVTIKYVQEQGQVIEDINNGQIRRPVAGITTLEKLQEQLKQSIVKNPDQYITVDNKNLVNAVLVSDIVEKIGTTGFTESDFNSLKEKCSGFLKEILKLKAFSFSEMQTLSQQIDEVTKQVIINLAKQPESTRKALAELPGILNRIGDDSFTRTDLENYKEIYNLDKRTPQEMLADKAIVDDNEPLTKELKIIYGAMTLDFFKDPFNFPALNSEEKALLIDIEIEKLKPANEDIREGVASGVPSRGLVNIAVSKRVFEMYRPSDAYNPTFTDTPRSKRPEFQWPDGYEGSPIKRNNLESRLKLFNYGNPGFGTVFQRFGYTQNVVSGQQSRFRIVNPAVSNALLCCFKEEPVANVQLAGVTNYKTLDETAKMSNVYYADRDNIDAVLEAVFKKNGNTLNVGDNGTERNDLLKS